jgi:hypothetical protein
VRHAPAGSLAKPMTSEGLGALARRALRVPGSFGASRSAEVARPRLPPPVHAALPIAIGGAWALVIQHVQLSGLTDLGLVSVLPRGTILLLFLLTTSFGLALARRPLRSVVPLIHVVVLIVMLYGITTFLEPEPRVSAVYKHVGVMAYIGHYGSVNPGYDAYFNWPGFFALGAMITQAAGFHSPLAFAAWGPILFNLLFLPPLIVIFRWASDDARVTWLGLWAFYSTNWVAQDHISPQATAYLLWLSILGALLTWFTPRPRGLAAAPLKRQLTRLPSLSQLRSLLQGGFAVAAPASTTTKRIVLFLLIVAMYGAIVTGHQLTPVPALLIVAGLVLFARLETRSLPVIMAVLLAAWVTYMASNYLAGNSATLSKSVGAVSQNVGQSVGGRFAGSREHELVVNLRVVATVLIWFLAAAGFARRLRGRRADVAMVVVGVAPFLLPALQPYGGEILLRVFLFALPAVSFFVASLAFPSEVAGRGWGTAAGVVLVGCLLLGLFQYTRYGNERLDNFTPDDAAIVHEFYRVAPPGATVYAPNDNLPWRYQDYTAYNYGLFTDLRAWRPARPNARLLAAELLGRVTSKGGGYVIVTRSNEIAADLLDGKPGVIEGVVNALRKSPAVRELYGNSDGELFRVAATPGA